MIFRRLNEAPEDMTSKPVSVVSRKPSEVNISHLPEDTKKLISQGKWTEAYRTLINTQDIEVFIEYFLMKYDGLKSFQRQLRPIHDVLSRAMMSLGDRAYQPETNPLLTFLNTFFAQGSEFARADQFSTLIGWWGDGIVVDKNLKETKVENSILLNSNLYTMSDNTFIVQAYYWLGDKRNVRAYLDLETTRDLDPVVSIEKQIKYILGPQGRRDDGKFDFKKVDYKKFRNLIIFVNPESPRGAINTAAEIQARLTRMQEAVNAVKELSGEDEAEVENKIYARRYTTDSLNKILTSGLSKFTKDDADVLLSYFKDRGYIR